MRRALIFLVCACSLAASGRSDLAGVYVQVERDHAKIISTHKDDRLCAEWDGRRKCVTAQQIMFIGAKDRQ